MAITGTESPGSIKVELPIAQAYYEGIGGIGVYFEIGNRRPFHGCHHPVRWQAFLLPLRHQAPKPDIGSW